ncbi:hypothetical protein ABPG72_010440 [Tetrahymena utriculariae]
MLFDYQNIADSPNNQNNLCFQPIYFKVQPRYNYDCQTYSEYSDDVSHQDMSQISSQISTNTNKQSSQIISKLNRQNDLSQCEFEKKLATPSQQSEFQMTSSINSIDNGSQYTYKNAISGNDSENRVQKRKQKLNLGNKQKNLDYVSTSTLHNIKTIRQYKQHLKNLKKRFNQTENQCAYTNLLVKQVPDREIFFLIGDIIVEPNFREEWYSIGEPSPYNYYKCLVRNIFYKERRILQSDYSQSDKGLQDFNNIVQILKNYPDQETHDYGLILEEYQRRCKELQQVGKIMKSNPDFQKFRDIQEKKYIDFAQRCEKYIEAQRSKKGEFFFYAFCYLDLDKFSYDIQSFGVSEAMSQLLGLELSTLSSVIQKKGLISSFSNCTRQMIMKNFIQALSKKYEPSQSQSSQDVSDTSILNLTVHTWDGLSINVEGHFHSFYDENSDFSLIPFTEIMSMVHVKVDESVLNAVYKMRSDQQTEKIIMEASGEDIYYNLQFQVFYDKFYASNNNDGEVNQEKKRQEFEEIQKKTCKYRNIV